MYNVQIVPEAQEIVERYILAYREAFLRLYDDTWLWEAENVIKFQYIQGAEILRDSFYKSISIVLKQQKILGYSYNEEKKIYTTTTRIWSRRLFLEYTEDERKQERTLLNINIISL